METDADRRASLATALALVALGLSPGAWAVNGAQPGGYGTRNASMGGTSIALPLDAEAAANNPAGMAFVPTSVVQSAQVFKGNSSSQYVIPGNELHNSVVNAAPEGGVNWQVSPAWDVGLSLAFAGAGSNYRQPALPVPGAMNAKASLMVAELIPTVAWKPRADLAIGVGLNTATERFEAQGVIVPAPAAGGLLQLPAHGKQSAEGVGVRAGVLWKATPEFSIGASLKSKTHMSRLPGYQDDLLAFSDGHLDIPSQYGVGVAWQPLTRFTLAADWMRIDWGDLSVMKDPNGFRWRNQPVWRLGAAWAIDDTWTLRGGYSRSHSQIDSASAAQNLLVPSINDQALSAGASWRAGTGADVSFGYEFDPRRTLQGTGASTGTSLTSCVQLFLVSYQFAF